VVIGNAIAEMRDKGLQPELLLKKLGLVELARRTGSKAYWLCHRDATLVIGKFPTTLKIDTQKNGPEDIGLGQN
jgi:hypothetical protein